MLRIAQVQTAIAWNRGYYFAWNSYEIGLESPSHPGCWGPSSTSVGMTLDEARETTAVVATCRVSSRARSVDERDANVQDICLRQVLLPDDLA